LEIQGNGTKPRFGIFLAARLIGKKGGYFMVGEFVSLTDISSICQWTNTLLVTVACIPFVFFALLHKLIPRRGSELFKLEWKEDYFERGFLTIAQPEDGAQQEKRVEDGDGEVQVPGPEDRQQTDNDKQAI
jgi:hypothetical protein